MAVRTKEKSDPVPGLGQFGSEVGREEKREEEKRGRDGPGGARICLGFSRFSNLNNWRREKEKKRKRNEGKERRGEICKIKIGFCQK